MFQIHNSTEITSVVTDLLQLSTGIIEIRPLSDFEFTAISGGEITANFL